jgi:hypothetical protein
MLGSLSWYFNKLLVCSFSRSIIKVNSTPKQPHILQHFSDSMHHWKIVAICVSISGEKNVVMIEVPLLFVVVH